MIEQLYTAYVEDAETQQVLTDLTEIAETFTGLSDEDFEILIADNIARIKKCRWEEEKEKIAEAKRREEEAKAAEEAAAAAAAATDFCHGAY